jgi:hypothetical protein
VVKHVDAVELRVVVDAVLAVAVDAVLVAQHLLKLGAYLVTALARLHVRNLALRFDGLDSRYFFSWLFPFFSCSRGCWHAPRRSHKFRFSPG